MNPNPAKRLALALLALLLAAAPASADPAADAIKALEAKGAKFTSAKGVVTVIDWPDASAATEADYRLVVAIPTLTRVGVGKGLSDAGVAVLAECPAVETIQVNSPAFTDDGVRKLAGCKTLTGLSIFHPGKTFTGTGLATLTNLRRLTVAGSDAFADDGMAAVATLAELTEFRTWHTGVTPAGVEQLKKLTKLRSLNVGQRLSYKPPAGVSDATVPVLAELKSLESLQLSEAKMSAAALVQLKALPKLKSLKLDGVMIEEADLEKVKAALPNVKVEWTKPSEAYEKRIKALNG